MTDADAIQTLRSAHADVEQAWIEYRAAVWRLRRLTELVQHTLGEPLPHVSAPADACDDLVRRA